MFRLHFDIETYSEADLTKVGAAVYAEHPSTEVTLLAYAVDDEEVEQVDFTAGDSPEKFLALFNDPSAQLWCWNSVFERTVLDKALGWRADLRRWRCSMVQALSLSLPAALAQAGTAIKLPQDKQKLINGKRLIRKFCQPKRPTKAAPWARCDYLTDPEDWAAFVEYNRMDVEAERAIHHRLAKWPMPDEEWAHWRLDRKVNEAGFPIDMEMVTAAIAVARQNKRALVAEAKAITGLDNPNSVPQLSGWLAAREHPTKDLSKHTVATLLLGELDDDVRRALEIRQQLGKGSLAKFDALERATNADGRLRNCLQFYGAARTGRWAGRVFQPQNLPRGSLDPEELHAAVEALRSGERGFDMDELASCIRPAVRAPEGKLLRVADLANIESRILGWISDCRRMLNVFASGGDIYADFGTELFQCDLSEIDKGRRNYAKPPTLGCGYGLGAKGLVSYAEGMFVTMTLEESQRAVDVFRSTYEEVVRLWRLLEQASMATIRDGRSRRVGRLWFEKDGPFLFMRLPSGRRLAYLHPRVDTVPAPWDSQQQIDQVTYMGTDQYTRQWCRLSTFGGKWVEQACQAISRDLLAHGLAEADAAGFEVVGHTHDELIALSDSDSWLDADVLSWCMVQMPPWGDDKLHLGAEGFNEVIYRKD